MDFNIDYYNLIIYIFRKIMIFLIHSIFDEKV